MMGASKRIMEMFLMRHSEQIDISTARFANVAFSDGSLLHSFKQRLEKHQPIVAPNDVLRYFITPQESGQLCLMSCLLGANRDIFFTKLDPDQHLMSFADIAKGYLRQQGYEPVICDSEQQARSLAASRADNNQWPCYFSASDTTGEKMEEEFFSLGDVLDMQRFANLGVICNEADSQTALLDFFSETIALMRAKKQWDKSQLVELFSHMLPSFSHRETGKYLDGKM
jgi:FlaA1/EpsC-like NDP-sugar epimerase